MGAARVLAVTQRPDGPICRLAVRDGGRAEGRIGITVTSKGQTIWLDSPDNPIDPG